jgi:gliding motility-associated-like protein
MSNPLDDPKADPFQIAEQAAKVIADKSGIAQHDIALTLGSGWAKAADLIGETVSTIDFFIYDRWGELIFESRNVLVGWDGSYGDKGRKAQDGIYIWKITFKNALNDKRRQVVGHVNLIR